VIVNKIANEEYFKSHTHEISLRCCLCWKKSQWVG